MKGKNFLNMLVRGVRLARADNIYGLPIVKTEKTGLNAWDSKNATHGIMNDLASWKSAGFVGNFSIYVYPSTSPEVLKRFDFTVK